jgi:hypothetical protein
VSDGRTTSKLNAEAGSRSGSSINQF